ncbi:hypothetical protein GKQ38_01425 [Candidatus Nanohaloarchaea archaeon]|nr:hypothetical protein GKQ38_01425 [Candidatus Nanohaloarchaea archaeon]
MPNNKTLGYTFITALAATTGYFAYQRTSAASAVFVIFATAWILYRFTSYEKIWDFLGYFIKPPMLAFIALLIGTTYFIFEGHLLNISLKYGLGIALLGAALAMWLYKYWNIGG